ncbi:MAG: PAS domain S-box protein, partial [Spirochaetota bacterium]
PVMDGFTLCRHWKQDPELHRIPLIFYTATYTDPKDEKFALNLGAERFIVKPAAPDRFIQIIEEVLAEYQAGKLTPAPDAFEQEEVYLKEYNQALLKKLEDKILQLEQANRSLIQEADERKKAQLELVRSEERFSKVFEQSPHWMTINTRSNGLYLDVNDTFCRITGRKREQVLGKAALDIGLWAYPEEGRRALEIIQREGSLRDYLIHFRDASGDLRQALWSAEPVTLEGKDCLISVLTDVTDMKAAEQALRESEEKYRSLIETVADPVIVYDQAGQVTYVNQAFGKVFGWTSRQVVGKRLDFIPAEEVPRTMAKLSEVMRGKPCYLFETKRLTKDGRTIDVSVSAANYRDDGGGHQGIVVSLQDITQRKLAEEEANTLQAQLRQAQKMEAIGTLAGGIAHDFNNILGAIIGFTDISLLSIPPDSPVRGNIQKVLDAGLRAKDLVKQILTFSRQTEQEIKPIRIGHIVEEVVNLLKATIPSNIEIASQIDADCVVMGDPSQLHQVVMNICTNAVQAMRAEGGSLEIKLDTIDMDAKSVRLVPEMSPGLYQRITVTDTGHGMTREVIDRIFEPFFTTKEKGQGTGLGLSVAHGIIKKLGGKTTAYSEPGKGSTFCIYLPVLDSGADAAPRSDAPQAMPTGSEHVLYVDDEELLVEVGGLVLKSLGYQVTCFTSSLKALEAFKNDPLGFDVLITDMNMPKMSGLDLARELTKMRPDLPIVLCTGFSERISASQSKALGIRKTIMKPMVARDIALAIREVLESG